MTEQIDFRIVPEAARVDAEWAVIDRLWNELRTPYEPDERLDALTPGQRAIYALTWTRSEVQNGGFHQYFWNPTGYLLPEAVAGAATLGAPAWTELLSRARDLFDPPFPRVRAARQEQLDRFSPDRLEALEGLDDELYDLDDPPETSLDALFRSYIEQHPDEFFIQASDEESASAALLESARSIVNSTRPRRLELAAELLAEASARSRVGGTGRVASLADSLLAQLPDLRT